MLKPKIHSTLMCLDLYMASNKSNSKICFPPSVLFPWPLQCLSSFSQSFSHSSPARLPMYTCSLFFKALASDEWLSSRGASRSKAVEEKMATDRHVKKMLSFFITAPLVLSCLVSLKKKKEEEKNCQPGQDRGGQSRDAHIQGCTKDADNILQENTQTAIKHVHLSFFTME